MASSKLSKYPKSSSLPRDSAVWRNIRGMELEDAGKTDEAIRLYEMNVSDHDIGSHPYERLRIIYTKRRDYADAIRVCQVASIALRGQPKKVKRFIDAAGKLVIAQSKASR